MHRIYRPDFYLSSDKLTFYMHHSNHSKGLAKIRNIWKGMEELEE